LLLALVTQTAVCQQYVCRPQQQQGVQLKGNRPLTHLPALPLPLLLLLLESLAVVVARSSGPPS
jgi:hypothetical protein